MPLWALAFTPIGAVPDHVIKGANQQTLAAGDVERVTKAKKPCKFWSPFDATSVLLCLYTVPKMPKMPFDFCQSAKTSDGTFDTFGSGTPLDSSGT